MSERMVLIRSFTTETDGLIAKAVLESAEIPVRIEFPSVLPYLQFSTGVRILVPESAVDDAEAALATVDEDDAVDEEE